MKKLMIIAALSILWARTGIAQGNVIELDSREKFQFGIKGGINYSNVYDAAGDEFDADPKAGLAAGISLDIPLGRYLGVQPGAVVSQKGFEASGMMLGSRYNFVRTSTFLDVPLLVSIKPDRFFSFLGGIQYSYLMNQHDEFSSSLNSYVQEEEFANENIRKNILGVVGGFDLNVNHFTIGARANWDLQHNNGDGTATTPRYKNVWYQATVGYKFHD